MWLIAGLGNPGQKYLMTRHNIGFLAVDYLAHSLLSVAPVWQEDSKALVCRIDHHKDQLLFVKPQTFMNKSGESVIPLLNYYKIPFSQLLVIQDDIDQPFQALRFHKNRGHGGHNGIRDISQQLGHADYMRLKLGVGRPVHPEMDVADYVLGKFSKEEQDLLPDFLNRAGDAVECLLDQGLSQASTKFNS